MEATEEEKLAFAQRAAAMEAKYAERAAQQPAALPASIPSFDTSDQGGEISMNVEDSNRLRVALGLKPLATSVSAQDSAKAEHRRHREALAARDRKQSEEEARERISAAKERRRLEAKLKETQALGAADEHEDDVGTAHCRIAGVRVTDVQSWLRSQKQRDAKEQNGGAHDDDKRAPGGKRSRRSKAPKTVDAAEHDFNLGGVKVKGSAVELEAGETLIATLADAEILAEDGKIAEEADVLQDYDKMQHEHFEKAKRKAQKKSLHFQEDGKTHNMLSKYDEEEDEMLLDLEQDATIDDSALKAKTAANLEAATTSGRFPTLEEKFGRMGEYLSTEEVKTAAFKKRKKSGKKAEGKARKVRKREAVLDDEDVDMPAAGGASLFDELEAAAMDDSADRGNRKSKRKREAEIEFQEAEEQAQRSRRFDLALEKANYAALAARAQDEAAADDEAIGVEDEEKQLEMMLAKTRSRAQREQVPNDPLPEEGTLAKLADDIQRDREEEQKVNGHLAVDGDILGETHDFVSGLEINEPEAEDMEKEELPAVEEDLQPVKEEPPPPSPPAANTGGWVAADLDPVADTAELQAKGTPKTSSRKFRTKGAASTAAPDAKESAASTSGKDGAMDAMLPSMSRQAGIRRGLAAALQLLRDSGTLKGTVSWAGRASDHRGNRLEKVKEALLDDNDELSAEVAAALQRRDEFGRIQTPKEAFRDISYAFHGMTKAASKKEKNMKAINNELTAKSVLSADNPSQLLDMYKAGLWKPPKGRKMGVGLIRKGKGKQGGKGNKASGKGNKGSKEVKPRTDANKFAGMVTPSLGGRDTPLEGDKKVEAMFGIKKPAK